jgi:Protein of unknown function (Hypoth_ymh)
MTTFWNDIEILRFIDACEQGERGLPHTGSELARALAEDRGISVDEAGYARFLHELSVLGEDELLAWNMVPIPAHVRQPTPAEPQWYLDHMCNFALTYRGRNQAKGRLIYLPTPDPTEDDGRIIRSMTLEGIADIIGAAYSPVQMLQFLSDSGVSLDGFRFGDVVGGAPAYAKHALYEMATGTSGRRRELRNFIGAWLDDRLHTGPSDDERDSIERDLARQGWFVKEGRLVIGEPVKRDRGTQTPAPAVDQLHLIVWKAAEARWNAKQLNDAVMAASKAVNAMLQAKVARTDVSEVKLVQAALSANPRSDGTYRLRFVDIDNKQTLDSMTTGVMNFGVGCFMAIRNPIGHLPDDQHDLTEQEALEQLAAWSLFARWIERAGVTRGVVDAPEE